MRFVQADTEITDPALAAELKKKRTFRTFSYRGVELDKLLDLSNEEVSHRSICIFVHADSIGLVR